MLGYGILYVVCDNFVIEYYFINTKKLLKVCEGRATNCSIYYHVVDIGAVASFKIVYNLCQHI